MAAFVNVYRVQGFDRYQTPPWQMVPMGGDRYVALRDGAGLQVVSSNPGIVTATEVGVGTTPATDRGVLYPSDRIFLLHGAAKGSARIRAMQNATGVAQLDVDAKNKRTVRVSFNFVRDSAGHHTTRATASTGTWTATMNYIYYQQANIEIRRRLTQNVSVAQDLGTVVEWKAGAGSEWPPVVGQGDAGADMNIFLVWEYEQDNTPTVDNTDAGTLGKNCIFEDNAGVQVAVTMAHELGHVLGLPDHYDAARKHHLMHGITDERGIHIPKQEVNKINV